MKLFLKLFAVVM